MNTEHNCGKGGNTECPGCGTDHWMRELNRSIRCIAERVDDSGPGGLEGLAMSISGEGPYGCGNSLRAGLEKVGDDTENGLSLISQSLDDLAKAQQETAKALNAIAEAITGKREAS